MTPVYSHSSQHISHEQIISYHFTEYTLLCLPIALRIKPNLFVGQKSPPGSGLTLHSSLLTFQTSSRILQSSHGRPPSLSLIVNAVSTMNLSHSFLFTWNSLLLSHTPVTFRSLAKCFILLRELSSPTARLGPTNFWSHSTSEHFLSNIHHSLLMLLFNYSCHIPPPRPMLNMCKMLKTISWMKNFSK